MLRYAATIFLSAFLLFLVQPLIGKYILPWFGGGSGVWTACLLFFQCVLLAGYLYVHVLATWFSPRWQMIVHLILLAGAAAFLPIIPAESFKPIDATQPVLRIVLLLTATLGLPYLALATTGPLLQSWFARTHAGAARSPYRLYALSNLGSLLALGGYPFVMEPALARPMQAYAWSGGFALFALLCAWCAIGQCRAPALQPSEDARSSAAAEPREVSTLHRVLWVILPMGASIMLLAATNQLSEEIAPMPFVWMLPLAVYLITFILAFEWPRLYDRRVFVALAIIAPWLYLAMLIDTHGGLFSQAALYMIVLFACCMICHGEAYRLRPAPRQLTAYYLAIALGGALGGVLVAVIAPMIFAFNLEIHLALFGSILLMGACLFIDPASVFHRGANRQAWLAILLTLAGAGYLISQAVVASHANAIIKARSFYGSLLVRDVVDPATGTPLRKLFHGRICHGSQSLIPEQRFTPLMYYAPHTGIGLTMELFARSEGRRVAVVGLGTGALAALGRPGDVLRFYEINPQIVEIAESAFSYIADSRAKIEIVVGDGRLSMEREPPQEYDIIVLDAFSGDAVPTHLLTREAFAVYRRHLRPGGVIAVNVTNRYLELHPVVHRLALDAGLDAALMLTLGGELEMISDAHWMILSEDESFLARTEIASANALPQGAVPRVHVWTDDYCSVLEVLR